MVTILLRHPNAGAPTTTITLNPTLARVEPFEVTPIQRYQVAESGKEYIFELSANREQLLTLTLEHLHEAADGSNSGVTALRSFFESTTNYAQNLFDLTDADSVTTTVRYWRGIETLRETLAGRFDGQLLLRKTLS